MSLQSLERAAAWTGFLAAILLLIVIWRRGSVT